MVDLEAKLGGRLILGAKMHDVCLSDVRLGDFDGRPVVLKHPVKRAEAVATMIAADHFAVKTVEYFEDEQVLVTERADKDLWDYMNHEKHIFSESELRSLVCSVLIALRCLHKCGVAHRDIKPENILVDGKRFLLADFGHAGSVHEGLIGTKVWTPPMTMAAALTAGGAITFPLRADLADVQTLGMVMGAVMTAALARHSYSAKAKAVLRMLELGAPASAILEAEWMYEEV